MTQLSLDELSAIAAHRGPCLTLVVADHHPGAPETSQGRQLLALLRDAKESAHGGLPQGTERAIKTLAASLPKHGGPGLVAYATPAILLSRPLRTGETKAVTASHPYVLPLLKAAFGARDLLALSLNTKQIRLYECSGGECSPVHLPHGVPASLEAAGKHHTPTTHGEHSTAAGVGAGAMGGVHFGTSGAREAARDSLEHFFALVDRGLEPLLGRQPLLLMGVREEIAAYRRVSHYDHLLSAEVDGNSELLTPAEIARIAAKAVEEEYYRTGLELFAKIRETRDRARIAVGGQAALNAALEGRVHQLCIREGTEVLAPADSTWNLAHLPVEDLANAAAVETLRRGGQVFLLPQDSVPVAEAVCALLRF